MRTEKDIGFIRKAVLKLLTKLQEVAIKSQDSSIYLALTKLHFKLYFKKNLVKEAVLNSQEFRVAAKRHGNMTITLLHGNSKRKSYLHSKISEAFQKDLILKANM